MTRSDPWAFDDQDAATASRVIADLLAARRDASCATVSRHDDRASFAGPVAMLFTVATGQLHLFVTYLQMIRNFHRIALIPCSYWQGFGDTSHDERQSVIEIERDSRIGIDLKFGSIMFEQGETEIYAVALVDVIVESATRVQMEVKIAADPETESIVGVTEKIRSHIVATLRAAADTFDATTSHALLFQKEAAPV